MFEFNIEQYILTEENERKPNSYIARALRIGFYTQTLTLLLNEVDIFHVDKMSMRICYVIAMLCTIIPQFITKIKALSVNPKCKYIALGCACAMTFVFGIAFFIFSAPLMVLPMLLAVQYNSRKMSRLAVIGSAICILVTPALGCVLRLWDTGFLEFLSACATGFIQKLTPGEPFGRFPAAINVLIYVSFPWLMMILMFQRLILSATDKGWANVQNQIRITQMSRLDTLTGLFNQNSYREFLESEFQEENAGILFFDVDGLKEANDTHGHEYGDLLLARCAQSLEVLFDDNCHGFRIGGDEFLVFVDEPDAAVLTEKLKAWEKSIAAINQENKERYDGIFCHMSAGSAFGSKSNISKVIAEADKNMYAVKEAYHQSLN